MKELYGIDMEQKILTLKDEMGMRKGEVCGACAGALMVLGLKYGQAKEQDMDSGRNSRSKR